MSYQLKEQKITPGGLNLLAPGDQVADGDCLNLQGWWAGAVGKLEQARSPSIRSVVAVMLPDSICQADGRIYYGSGSYGNLRQVGRAAEAAIDTGYDAIPLGMLSYQGYVWIMNQAKQRKDDGTAPSDWTPAAPTIPTAADQGLGGGLLNQAYDYYTTWQLGTLGETNPSPVATVTPAVDLSFVKVTPDAAPPATATGWHLYRKSPQFAAPYRVNADTIPIATTFLDDYGDEEHDQSDPDLLSLGILMEADHDAAPACKVIANQVYNGRIVVANSAAHPNRIWYTPALQPGFFRGSGNPNAGDWVDVGTDMGDEVLVMTVRPGMVIIYRSRSIWRHVGDFGAPDARLECVVPDQGVCGVHGAVQTSVGDFFVSNDGVGIGVYKFNGDWAQKQSQKVETVLRGVAAENFWAINELSRATSAIGYRNGRLWVSYPKLGGGIYQPSQLIYDINSERWFNDSLGYVAYLDTGAQFLGASSGGVYAIENIYNHDLSLLDYQSAYIDCGQPDRIKTFADLVLHHNTQGWTLTVAVRINKGGVASEIILKTIQSYSLTNEVIPLVLPGYPAGPELGTPIAAYNISIRVYGHGTTDVPPIYIDTPIILHYYVEARRGKRFDTSPTDHGMEGVKLVDQVELDIDATDGDAGASLQVSSDIPGGTMAQRASVNIQKSTGRESRRLVLNPVAGKLVRYRVDTPTGIQVYGMRARVLPIGVYLDGTVGDYWAPQPISIGV